MATVIRDFKSDEFEALWQMDQECFPPGIAYSRPELKTYMRHRGAFTLVAEEADEHSLQGFLVAHAG